MSDKDDHKISDTEKYIFRLTKVDSNNVELCETEESLKSSKKFAYTKRKINRICRSLSFASNVYDPEITLTSIDSFLDAKDNMGRILYSEVSSYVFSLSDEDRNTFSSNIERLLLNVLNDVKNQNRNGDDNIEDGTSDGSKDQKKEDVKKFVIKLYDHFQLVLYQINNTDKQYAKSIETTRNELQTEVKGMEKEYISILGIFASIVLAFIGGMTFSTSVLENIADASIYRIIMLTLIIAFVFLNMIWLLMDFIRAVNGNSIKRQSIIWWLDIGIVIAIILTCLACHFGWLDHEGLTPRFSQESTSVKMEEDKEQNENVKPNFEVEPETDLEENAASESTSASTPMPTDAY